MRVGLDFLNTKPEPGLGFFSRTQTRPAIKNQPHSGLGGSELFAIPSRHLIIAL